MLNHVTLQTMRQVALLAAAATLLGRPAFAADRSQWTNLDSLRPGDRVAIIERNETRIEGRFQSSSTSQITIDAGTPVSVARTDVLRVDKQGLSRTKKSVIGAAIGLAAAAILAAGVSNASSNEGFFSNGAAKGLTISAGAGVGAAIGALSGRGYKVIYQAPPNGR